MNKLTEDIKKKISACTHHTTVILIDRDNKKVIGNVCEIYSMKNIADVKDDIWHLCNWSCWNGTANIERTYNEHCDDEYRVAENKQTYMIPLNRNIDTGYVDHNIMFIDNDNADNVKFWVAQSFGWVYVDTISQALDISIFSKQEDI